MPLNVNIFNKELIPVQSDYGTYTLSVSSDLPDLSPYATTSQLSAQASRFINYLPLSGGTLTGPLTAQNIIAGNTTVTGLTARGPVALVGSISGVNSRVSFNTSLVQGDGSFGAGSSTVAGPNAAAFGLNTYAGSEGGYAAGSQTSVGYGTVYTNLASIGGGQWQITIPSAGTPSVWNVGSFIRVVITDGVGGNATPVFVLARIVAVGYGSNNIVQVVPIIGTLQNSSGGYVIHNQTDGAGPGAFGATAFGFQTVAIGDGSFSTGMLTAASGLRTVAMGYQTKAYGDQSMALGNNTIARANNSVAVGFATVATGDQSYAEGNDTRALGNNSHTEGYQTSAFGNESHAESFRTRAGAFASHAEGIETVANGTASHAEGENTQALGPVSHAEGYLTRAFGVVSHAAGIRAVANNYSYVWADGDGDLTTTLPYISSTRTKQYMVSASNGFFVPGKMSIGVDDNSNSLTVKGILSSYDALRFPFFGSAPSNTTTPVNWLDVFVNDTLYKLPLYQ